MSRHINFTAYPMAHPPMMEWIKANGLDPRHLLYDQKALLDNGELTVAEIVFEENGAKRINGDRVVTKTVTVPLISAPENHGL